MCLLFFVEVTQSSRASMPAGEKTCRVRPCGLSGAPGGKTSAEKRVGCGDLGALGQFVARRAPKKC